MKAIALGNRLARDLNTKSVVDLSADMRLEILDAINGGLQRLHALALHESKQTAVSLSVTAPMRITLSVTDAASSITGHAFTADDIGCTLRIDGDNIDNQVIGGTSLLHPYSGASGTVGATLYHDAVAIPEIYEELVGDPVILETGRHLTLKRPVLVVRQRRAVTEPTSYWVEANARNQNSSSPSILRLEPIPEKSYRMSIEATMAPARITFADLLSSGADVPLRSEHVESYLLPVARGILTSSEGWKDKESKAAATNASEKAIADYALLAPKTLSTPSNRAGTRRGF